MIRPAFALTLVTSGRYWLRGRPPESPSCWLMLIVIREATESLFLELPKKRFGSWLFDYLAGAIDGRILGTQLLSSAQVRWTFRSAISLWVANTYLNAKLQIDRTIMKLQML
jgi:hypothetical protein